MNIEIAFKHPLRRWQQRLACKLRAKGHRVSLVARGRRKAAWSVGIGLLAQRRLFGPCPSLFDIVEGETDDAPASPDAADLVIALDGVNAGTIRALEPLFDGRHGDDALLAMVVGSKAPSVELRMRDGGQPYAVVTARLAMQDRVILTRDLEQVLARTITLLIQAVRRIKQGDRRGAPALKPCETSSHAQGPALHMIRGSARKIVGRLTGAKRGPNHWRVGYRRTGAPDGHETRRLTQNYTILPDDGRRFYADPIPFEHEGRSFIFVEDYPYATGKGVIAVVEIDAGGQASAPRLVLEHSCHLSYPYIIRHRGEIYMMPEMSGAGRIQLFRADPFPDRWLPDRILIDEVVAADATPIEHEGRWWMFAALSDDGGSTWDQLCLFHAPDFFGPWTPHVDNPVLVDAGSARPAGFMWHENGALMRVAQDCRGGYGLGLAICRVDRLDEQGYSQALLTRLGPPDGCKADGIHTLNCSANLEVVDLRFASQRRSAALRAPGRG